MRKLLVYGGKGALGNHCIEYFKSKGWWICSIDKNNKSQIADLGIVIENDLYTSIDEQGKFVESALIDHVGEGNKFEGIFCFAGGWEGGNVSSQKFRERCESMIQKSLNPSIVTASLAKNFLKENGLLVLTGAQAALGPTSGMIGYGLAKAAVHHLVTSCGNGSGFPNGSKCVAILPATLDTPKNRTMMKKADFSTWTPLDHISEKLSEWVDNPSLIDNGKLMQVITKDFNTEFVPFNVE